MNSKVFLLSSIAIVNPVTVEMAQAAPKQAPDLKSPVILEPSSVTNNKTIKDAPNINTPSKLEPSSIQPKLAQQPRPNPQPTPTTPTNTEARVLISEVLFRANQGELPADLRAIATSASKIKAGQPITKKDIDEDLQALQATGDFEEIKIEPEDTPKGVRLTYVLTPFKMVREISIKTLGQGESKVISQEDLNNLFQPIFNKRLNLRELQKPVQGLNRLYKDRGYDLAQIVQFDRLGDDGKLTLIVAEGVIEEIKPRFLTKDRSAVDENKNPITGTTRDFIITREFQLKPGDVFNAKTAQRDLRRLFGLGLFDDVGISFQAGKDPSKVVVVIDVIERKTGSIVAGGGFSSSNGLFGTVSYQQQNLGGNNQKLGAEVQIGQRELLFDVNFNDPWIAGDPYRTAYGVNAFQRRSISLVFDGGKNVVRLPNGDTPRVLRQGGGVTFSRPLSGNPYDDSEWRGSLGLQYQKVSTRDINGNIAPKDALGNNLTLSNGGEDDVLTLQLGLTQDLRDSFFVPSKGSLLKIGVDQAIPIGSGNASFTRLRGSYTYYQPVSLLNLSKESPEGLVFNLQGGTALGTLPPYEAFVLGGTSSVRGFEEGDVGAGKSYVQASAEYRFPLFSIVGGTFFVDAASDLGTGKSVPGDPAGIRQKPGNGIGYGAGVRIQSPLGPIRLDYALNNQGESRLQFGIGERF